MSLFKYFSRGKKVGRNAACDNARLVVDDMCEAFHPQHRSEGGGTSSYLSEHEVICIRDELDNIANDAEAPKPKRMSYSEKDKERVGRYAAENGVPSALKKFKTEFPKLTQSTVRPWSIKYTQTLSNPTMTMSAKRGRPLYLSAELDKKLRTMLVSLRTGGAAINSHVVKGVLAGLVRSNIVKYGQFSDFQVNRSWVRSLYQRMKFSRRCSTTSRPIITRSVWEETRDQFLHDIASKVSEYNIPENLIYNADQTPSKYVPTSNITMAQTNAKHVAIKGGADKRSITVTVTQSLSGEMLPFQIIYTGKTKRCLPKNAQKIKHNFLFGFNPSHWSNEEETLRLINSVQAPHIEEVKEKLGLPDDAKSLLIWDAFKGQNTDKVKGRLEELNILSVMVPKNLTHLLQPLDITTNGKIKKLERKAFSEYLTSTIMNVLLEDPEADVANIDIDLKLSTLKPKHLANLGKIYEYFKTEEGKSIILSGFRFTGISDIVTKAKDGSVTSLNPYA